MPDQAQPIVYTIRGCDACVKLSGSGTQSTSFTRNAMWNSARQCSNEARGYGDLVPIVVWPDGRVETRIRRYHRLLYLRRKVFHFPTWWRRSRSFSLQTNSISSVSGTSSGCSSAFHVLV